MIRRLLVLAFVLAAGALIWGVLVLREDEPEQLSGSPAALSVSVVLPREDVIAETTTITGVTSPREEIQIMTELSGVRVRDVLVDVGDKVSKGEVLATLDVSSLSHEFDQLRSNYEQARDAFERVDPIKDTGAVSRQSVIEKRAAMQAAKAILDVAELDLRRSTIIAPEDGVIFVRNAVIGGLIDGSEPLFRIARHDEIEVEAMAPETLLFVLKPGQLVNVSLTGQRTPLEGKIRLVSPRVDDATRQAAIRIALDSGATIPVGLFATVQILESERTGLLLPKSAVQSDADGEFVWSLSPENEAERLPVTVTYRGDDEVMVDVIPADARVIARAGAFVRQGDRVNVVDEN